LSKIQKKAVNKVFDQIIEVNKYVNPVNKKTLDAMKKETMIKNEQFLSNNGKGVSKKIENLYKDYIQQTHEDLLEQADKAIDNHKRKLN